MSDDSYPMHQCKRCGARTRTGSPCMAPAMRNGRCRMHGGASLSGRAHGRYKHGEFTKAAQEQRRRLRELLKLAKQFLDRA
ncbi:HGGxSTG domain-containing protein [Dehalococcoides sp. THU3]|uniref:HGGxSTG domain-containing protein n=1 Tax=Dehalococcoides sp. THU3 TaxID=3151601 RepID=UPI0032189124